MKNTKLENREYYDKLFLFAKDFVSKQMKSFTSDDLKIEYFKSHNKPNNTNVFGNVFSGLSKLGLIKETGTFTKSKFKEAHGRILKEWISQRYSDIQSKKRILDETIQSRELAKTQTKLF